MTAKLVAGVGLGCQLHGKEVGTIPCPGNDDISMFSAGSNILIKHRLHKLCVLLNDASNISTSHCNISLYPAAIEWLS